MTRQQILHVSRVTQQHTSLLQACGETHCIKNPLPSWIQIPPPFTSHHLLRTNQACPTESLGRPTEGISEQGEPALVLETQTDVQQQSQAEEGGEPAASAKTSRSPWVELEVPPASARTIDNQ